MNGQPTITNKIEVVPYDSEWPQIFKKEAENIRLALGDNCIAIHHIGSTSIRGLAAKPIIDIVPVVRNIDAVDLHTQAMLNIGYVAKGEYGILFRRYFQKNGFNIHVFEEGSAEIEGHLLFRNWMISHQADRENYAQLKTQLAKLHPDDIFQYVSGKETFIQSILTQSGYQGLRIVKALSPQEWNTAKELRQQYYRISQNSDDPHASTFKDDHHIHLILYQGPKIIGYAHIQNDDTAKATINVMSFINEVNKKELTSTFIQLCEKWLKKPCENMVHIYT